MTLLNDLKEVQDTLVNLLLPVQQQNGSLNHAIEKLDNIIAQLENPSVELVERVAEDIADALRGGSHREPPIYKAAKAAIKAIGGNDEV